MAPDQKPAEREDFEADRCFQSSTGSMVRLGLTALGMTMLVLGFIGAVVPVMPTTVFLILAAGCFSRSPRRPETWILSHPRFGPIVTGWRAEGAVPRRAKVMACTGMALGYTIFWIAARSKPLLAVFIAGLILASAVYVLSRPSPKAFKRPAQPASD